MNSKCQVFTPVEIVEEMLKILKYENNMFGKKIIENACGDGNIILEIVRNYITIAVNNGFSKNKIVAGLESDIYGAEIDPVHYKNCLNNLNKLAEEFGIFNVKWNIFNVDILRFNLKIKFDYVIGNPPYITYNELDVNTRSFLKTNYLSCIKGKFDYCYSFIEHGINLLNDNGKMIYLIPNSIFKNVYANNLRNIMLPNLQEIYDYTTLKIFKNASTSSSIILFNKSNYTEKINYYNIVKNEKYEIYKDTLKKKWIFEEKNKGDLSSCEIRFGDHFHCSISIATLLNEAFIIKNNFNDMQVLEKKILFKAVSPRSKFMNREEYIIFPYFYKDNEVEKYNEIEFNKLFPQTVKHLSIFKNKLNLRTVDKSVKWFEYGRSQGLKHLNKKKLLMSSIITNRPKVYELEIDEIPYSGIIITSKNDNSLVEAKKILNSDEFMKYIMKIGINVSGHSLRISPKDVNNFTFKKSKKFNEKI